MNASPPLKKMTIYQFDEDRNTDLHIAAARGNTNDVLKHLENGHKVNVENDYGWTPLMMATRHGHLDIIKLLLRKQSDATRINKFGASIFLMAISCGNLEIIDVILEHLLCGGVSKQSMESTFSPISVSIVFNCEHVFKYLLGKSFNVNATNSMTGLTPFMFAAIIRDESYTHTLSANGANPHLKNACGATAAAISAINAAMVRVSADGGSSRLSVPRHHSHHPHHPHRYVYVNQQQPQQLVSPHFIVYADPHQSHPPASLPPALPLTPLAAPLGYYPQIFFSSEFSPAQVLSPFSFPGISPGYILSPNVNIPSPNIVF